MQVLVSNVLRSRKAGKNPTFKDVLNFLLNANISPLTVTEEEVFQALADDGGQAQIVRLPWREFLLPPLVPAAVAAAVAGGAAGPGMQEGAVVLDDAGGDGGDLE